MEQRVYNFCVIICIQSGMPPLDTIQNVMETSARIVDGPKLKWTSHDFWTLATTVQDFNLQMITAISGNILIPSARLLQILNTIMIHERILFCCTALLSQPLCPILGSCITLTCSLPHTMFLCDVYTCHLRRSILNDLRECLQYLFTHQLVFDFLMSHVWWGGACSLGITSMVIDCWLHQQFPSTENI